MAVIGVLAKAEIGDQQYLRAKGLAQPAQRSLHDAVIIPGRRPLGILVRRNTEQDHAPDADRQRRLHLTG
jgi:hypothetical protein